MSNGRLIQPNALQIKVLHADGPMAQPIGSCANGPGELLMIAAGGLTKLEDLTGRIAASNPDMSAAMCRKRAQQILDECGKPSQPETIQQIVE